MSFFKVGQSSFDDMARQIEAAAARGQELESVSFNPGLFQSVEELLSELVDYARSMQTTAERYGSAKGSSAKTWSTLAQIGEYGLRQQSNAIARDRGF